MNTQYFQKLTEAAKHLQQPLQSWQELNLKTLRQFHYMKPEELAKIRKPEEFFEKQLSLTIENSHNVLEYMQQSFKIMEGALKSMNSNLSETDFTAPIKSAVHSASKTVKESVTKVQPTKKTSTRKKSK